MEDIKFHMNNQIKAVNSYYQAKKDRAVADLEIYLNRPVGVGEHNSITDEVIKILEDLEHSNSMLEMIGKMVLNQNDTDTIKEN
jgi:hypothetical protein